jgi:23S rRNA U2552 (ribose-2'-O)-methylase RlmE/FtsJ
MIHFQIPRHTPDLYKNIEYCDENDSISKPKISDSLSHYIYEIKERIQLYDQEWDIFKRYTNPYEYIHTNVPNKKKSVSKHKPLSRSYFKMVELTNFFKLIDEHRYAPISTFHLAEGPGGFIEALVHMRQNRHDKYIGMTILDKNNDPTIPGWKKSENFLKENKNVFIEKGVTGTGDILSVENFKYIHETYKSSMDIITGDGGFDFSGDFNNQENSIIQLLFAQVAYAIVMQKKGGSFILKLFDCFMQPTLDILAIVSSFYKKVYITKPQTSRYANSEKYLVCQDFIFESTEDFMPHLMSAFEKMIFKSQIAPKEDPVRFLNITHSNHFITRMEEYNSIFGQQQVENIYYTIYLIDNKNKQDKIDTLIKNNSNKCVTWCIKNDIQYNSLCELSRF